MGHGYTDFEIADLVDQIYLEEDDVTMSLVDAMDMWTSARHPLNDRGDEDSVLDREQSVNAVGILDLRTGPWFIERTKDQQKICNVFPPHVKFLLMHWGTLLSGAERAYKKDTKKVNKAVQVSVKNGVKHCKKYSSKTPDDVIKFIVAKGNWVNDKQTPPTFLEVFRCTKECETGFSKKRTSMGWTTNRMTQGHIDKLRFLYVQGLWPKRWPHFRNYEICANVYREATKVTTERTPILFIALCMLHHIQIVCFGTIQS